MYKNPKQLAIQSGISWEKCKRIDSAWKKHNRTQELVNAKYHISRDAFKLPPVADLLTFHKYEECELIDCANKWENETPEMIALDNQRDMRKMFNRLMNLMRTEEKAQLQALLDADETVLMMMGSILPNRYDKSCWLYRIRENRKSIAETACINELVSVYRIAVERVKNIEAKQR